ncbi:hypothetical protein ACQUQU_12405 [Thalassolituus sp. LLYu03]|uniref:hypothetical protein n=1 Tax=Thalassolituus sp. LLYu03 TaxID=3421656 RepID=UPI003D29C88E
MQTKMTLHGAGVYYFQVTGAKDQPIFNSVFEFEYGRQLLASIRATRLLAYVLDDKSMQFVLRCERDWTEVMDDVQSAFDAMHERCWNKRRQVLSDQGVVLLVDEQAFLQPLILQLHDWPRRAGLVASAELWPWSSDRYYRDPNPPQWIDTESMLNLLSHSRRNRSQHYIDVMQMPVNSDLDLVHGSHPLYQALGRDSWVSQHLKKEALVQSAYSKDDVRRLFDDACQLVASQFEISTGELLDRHQRRRFHHLMPLVVWLMSERGIQPDALTALVDEDEFRMQLWLRNLEADHAENILLKLKARWQPQAPALPATPVTAASQPEPSPAEHADADATASAEPVHE